MNDFSSKLTSRVFSIPSEDCQLIYTFIVIDDTCSFTANHCEKHSILLIQCFEDIKNMTMNFLLFFIQRMV